MSTQSSFDLPVRVRTKPVKQRVKRADEFKSLPLTDNQLQWAIGHNLQWVLSIVQKAEVAV